MLPDRATFFWREDDFAVVYVMVERVDEDHFSVWNVVGTRVFYRIMSEESIAREIFEYKMELIHDYESVQSETRFLDCHI